MNKYLVLLAFAGIIGLDAPASAQPYGGSPQATQAREYRGSVDRRALVSGQQARQARQGWQQRRSLPTPTQARPRSDAMRGDQQFRPRSQAAPQRQSVVRPVRRGPLPPTPSRAPSTAGHELVGKALGDVFRRMLGETTLGTCKPLITQIGQKIQINEGLLQSAGMLAEAREDHQAALATSQKRETEIKAKIAELMEFASKELPAIFKTQGAEVAFNMLKEKYKIIFDDIKWLGKVCNDVAAAFNGTPNSPGKVQLADKKTSGVKGFKRKIGQTFHRKKQPEPAYSNPAPQKKSFRDRFRRQKARSQSYDVGGAPN